MSSSSRKVRRGVGRRGLILDPSCTLPALCLHLRKQPENLLKTPCIGCLNSAMVAVGGSP